MWKMGLSIFAAMNRLKLESTTNASLPIIPSTERTKEEICFCLLQKSFPCFSFVILYQPANNLSNITGFQVSVTASPKPDVNNHFYLALPQALYLHTTPFFQDVPSVTHLLLGFSASQSDQGFVAYALKVEGLFCKVGDLVTRYIFYLMTQQYTQKLLQFFTMLSSSFYVTAYLLGGQFIYLLQKSIFLTSCLVIAHNWRFLALVFISIFF